MTIYQYRCGDSSADAMATVLCSTIGPLANKLTLCADRWLAGLVGEGLIFPIYRFYRESIVAILAVSESKANSSQIFELVVIAAALLAVTTMWL